MKIHGLTVSCSVLPSDDSGRDYSARVLKTECDIENFINGPTTIVSAHERHIGNAKVLRPICNAHGSSTMDKDDVAASVFALVNLKDPLAILGAIGPVIINALDRVLGRRTRPHIGHEVLERIEPSVADVNTATSIAGVAFRVWVSTPGLHAGPDRILRTFSLAMSAVSKWIDFRFQAPARASALARDFVPENYGPVSAVTLTKPSLVSRRALVEIADHLESSASFAS